MSDRWRLGNAQVWHRRKDEGGLGIVEVAMFATSLASWYIG